MLALPVFNGLFLQSLLQSLLHPFQRRMLYILKGMSAGEHIQVPISFDAKPLHKPYAGGCKLTITDSQHPAVIP